MANPRKQSARRQTAGSARAAGTLTTGKRRGHGRTVLKVVNAPGHKRRGGMGRMSSLKTVNAPGHKRRSLGSSGAHTINAPRGKR